MKSPPTQTDDCDDIFGPPRSYSTGYYPPKTRPSMISAKYRQKEERRKVLKISINKLKKIEDPETSLCRSVLINNTMKRLQKEARDEKIHKQQLNYPRCYDNDNFLNLKSEFIKNELKNNYSHEDTRSFPPIDSKIINNLKVDFINEHDFNLKNTENLSVLNNDGVTNLVIKRIDESLNGYGTNNNITNAAQIEDNERFSSRKRLFEDIEDCSVQDIFQKSMVMNGLIDECIGTFTTNNNIINVESMEHSGRLSSRKRSFDDMDDCDVQEVLSQFYMPPTPRMLTCIDDDEDVNVVDDEPVPKRAKNDISVLIPSPQILSINTDINSPKHNQNSQSPSLARLDTLGLIEKVVDKKDYRVNSYSNNNVPETDSRLRFVAPTQSMDADTNAFSCGHASMFSELQSNVFHSLIASLET